MTNLIFSFSESGPGSVHIPPKPIFCLSFRTFKGTLKILQMTFCPQIQQEKSLKWPLNLNLDMDLMNLAGMTPNLL